MTAVEDRPWERPGQLRRDAAPHRGWVLLALAAVSVVCGWLACCLVVPSFLGFPLAVAACLLSRQDMARMRAGLVDRDGWGHTYRAWDLSITGLILNGLIFGYATVILLGLLSQF
jgi:hypothetical protein